MSTGEKHELRRTAEDGEEKQVAPPPPPSTDHEVQAELNLPGVSQDDVDAASTFVRAGRKYLKVKGYEVPVATTQEYLANAAWDWAKGKQTEIRKHLEKDGKPYVLRRDCRWQRARAKMVGAMKTVAERMSDEVGCKWRMIPRDEDPNSVSVEFY